MVAMKGFGFALEKHVIEDIANTMGYLNLARSERYRNLVILGLDEYSISGSELRKKKFPINGKKLIPFTVMLTDGLNQEIEKVKKKRNQIKRLAIRYIVLLGFEKFKRDNPHPIKEIDLDKKVDIPFCTEDTIKGKINAFKLDDNIKPLDLEKGKEITQEDIDKAKETHTTIPSEFHKNNMAGPDPEIKPVSNDINLSFQAVIELVKKLDLKITIENK